MENSQIAFLIIACLYTIIILVFLFLSFFTVYILIRYGKSKSFSLFLSLIYCLGFISFTLLSLSILYQIKP